MQYYANITHVRTLNYEILQELRNITHIKLRKFTDNYEILRLRKFAAGYEIFIRRKFTKYYEILRLRDFSDPCEISCEILRNITKYYAYEILRRAWKLTKFFHAEIYASFRTKKFPDA